MKQITIIGAGKLGCSIADGLLDSGIDPKLLTLTRRHTTVLNAYKDKGVHITSDNIIASQNADLIILCVKPYKVFEVIEDIQSILENKIIVCCAAGISLKKLEDAVKKDISTYIAMPNTAAAISASMTCISTNDNNQTKREFVNSVFENIGETVFIEDELMAAATVLASSGIAFALRYIRASMQAGIEIGFSSELAQKLVAQTVKGAAELILTHKNHPEHEIDRVTTPQGITIKGLSKMEQEGFSSSVIQGILASQHKIENL